MTATAAPTVIDDGTFLAISGAFAIALLCVLFIVFRLPHHEYAARRLAKAQQKRETRIARGSDRYFEELRAIDARIEELQQELIIPRRPHWLRIAHFVYLVSICPLIAMWVVDWIAPKVSGTRAPDWFMPAYAIGPFVLGVGILLGAANSVDKHRWPNFMLGGIMIAFGILTVFTP